MSTKREQTIEWQDYMPAARLAVEASRERYGIPGVDLRCESEAGSGGADAGEGGGNEGGQGGAGGVDLSSPQVQAAISAAERRAREAARAELEPHKQQLLDELKPYKGLGRPDEVKARLAELEKLKTARQAADAGTDPEKFKSAVDAAAQEKANEYIAQYRDRDKANETKISELEAKVAETEKLAHRRFVESAIVRAAMPEDTKIVQDGAWDFLVSQLEPMVVPHELEGLGVVPRLKRNDALVPTTNGKSPDGLMDLRELFSLSRHGKGPVPNIGFCFVSNGAGSGTQTPPGSPSGPGNFHKLTQEQRMTVLREHFKGDKDKYLAWMEDSPKPDAAGAAAT